MITSKEGEINRDLHNKDIWQNCPHFLVKGQELTRLWAELLWASAWSPIFCVLDPKIKKSWYVSLPFSMENRYSLGWFKKVIKEPFNSVICDQFLLSYFFSLMKLMIYTFYLCHLFKLWMSEYFWDLTII